MGSREGSLWGNGTWYWTLVERFYHDVWFTRQRTAADHEAEACACVGIVRRPGWGSTREGRLHMATTMPAGYSAQPAIADDAQRVAELIATCQVADGGEPEMTAEELPGDWVDLDLAEETVVVAAPDGDVGGGEGVHGDHGHVDDRGVARGIGIPAEGDAGSAVDPGEPGSRRRDDPPRPVVALEPVPASRRRRFTESALRTLALWRQAASWEASAPGDRCGVIPCRR